MNLTTGELDQRLALAEDSSTSSKVASENASSYLPGQGLPILGIRSERRFSPKVLATPESDAKEFIERGGEKRIKDAEERLRLVHFSLGYPIPESLKHDPEPYIDPQDFGRKNELSS